MPFDLSAHRIDATETRLGIHLPVAYRTSMGRENGGVVLVDGETWCLHPMFDDADVRRLKRTTNDVVHETTEARGWPGFPSAGIDRK